MEKRHFWPTEFSDVTVRVGSMRSANGVTAIDTANTVCGVFGTSAVAHVSMECSPPICGRYVSVEKAGPRFEFMEIFVNDCGLGPC